MHKKILRQCRILVDHFINRNMERKKKKFKIPVIKISADVVFDRFGNQYRNNILVKILNNIKKTKGIKDKHYGMLRQHYIFLYKNQKGGWLKHFIGCKKDVNYGIVPWRTGKKSFAKRQVSSQYSHDYLKRLVEITKSIRSQGYSSKKGGHISGELIVNSKGQKRFIVHRGQRRMAALVHLGIKEINVELFNGFNKSGKPINCIILQKDVNRWENVRNKIFTKKEALKFFNHFFK